MTPVPTGWKRANLRRFAAMKTGHTPSRSVAGYWTAATIPWFTLADVWQLRDGRQTYLGNTASKISELGLANSAAELLPAGTVVLSRTASVGFSGVMPVPMATSQDFWNWVCGPGLVPEYLNYQFKAMAPELRAMNMGSTHQTIYQKDAASIRVLVPPLETQRAVVNYLDRETAKIDTLVSEQQRLVELLQERRQAEVVAATDSLPDAPYSRMKYIVTGTRQGWSPQCYPWPADGVSDWAVLKAGAANAGTFRPKENKELPATESPRPETVVREGQLVVSRANTRDLVGSAAVVTGNYPRLMLSDKLYAFEIDRQRALPEFVALSLSLPATRDAIKLEATGTSSSMQNVSKADLLNVPLRLPPIDVQRAVLARIESGRCKIDALVAETKRFIGLAQERRSSLIAAAVEGRLEMPGVK